MKELVYKFQNPHNSCEEIHYHPETKRYYVLMPHTPYSKKLCTCTPSKGWYEADCPVRAGLTYVINGEQVTTEADGEIIDHAKKEEYENRVITFYQIRPDHLSRVTLKRKEVCCLLGSWDKNDEPAKGQNGGNEDEQI